MQNINELDLGKRTYTAYKTRVTESLRAFIETDDADVEQQALQRVDALVSEVAALSVSLISLCYTVSLRRGRTKADNFLELVHQTISRECGSDVAQMIQIAQRQGFDDLASKLKVGNS
ncbi:MAG: hypothetical protein Q4A98_08685 [Comamonadaceae bacterium]|nr:hypothetical protein [Comamonadaceae bacterium]